MAFRRYTKSPCMCRKSCADALKLTQTTTLPGATHHEYPSLAPHITTRRDVVCDLWCHCLSVTNCMPLIPLQFPRCQAQFYTHEKMKLWHFFLLGTRHHRKALKKDGASRYYVMWPSCIPTKSQMNRPKTHRNFHKLINDMRIPIIGT